MNRVTNHFVPMFLHNHKNIAVMKALLDEVTEVGEVRGDIGS